jgi:hypothetical protein
LRYYLYVDALMLQFYLARTAQASAVRKDCATDFARAIAALIYNGVLTATGG